MEGLNGAARKCPHKSPIGAFPPESFGDGHRPHPIPKNTSPGFLYVHGGRGLLFIVDTLNEWRTRMGDTPRSAQGSRGGQARVKRPAVPLFKFTLNQIFCFYEKVICVILPTSCI